MVNDLAVEMELTRVLFNKVTELKKDNEALKVAMRGAVAALTQNKTYPCDIDLAKKWLTDALSLANEPPKQ